MDLQKRNISSSDLILCYFSYLKQHLNIPKKIRTLLIYRKVYRNYFSVYKSVSWEKYPIKAIMRNGDSVIIRNYLEMQIDDARPKGFECAITNDTVTLSALKFDHKKVNITIYGGTSNGDIRGIFVDNVYQHLPVKNKTVIDIGANIGDSAIYFALSGATKIICLEPFPKNYELAEKNIKLNNFSNNITLLLAGCSGNRAEITIDPEYKSGYGTILKDFKKGIKVPLLTLEDILKENNLSSDDSIILKMDCEGCEYETILSANENTLQKFSHIMIEYHHGYKNLKEKLEKSGFKVSVTRPTIYWYSPDEVHEKIKFLEGYIIARR
jgi:FkbM family methyltransferase